MAEGTWACASGLGNIATLDRFDALAFVKLILLKVRPWPTTTRGTRDIRKNGNNDNNNCFLKSAQYMQVGATTTQQQRNKNAAWYMQVDDSPLATFWCIFIKNVPLIRRGTCRLAILY